ncbi:MAG: hypothetical protein VXW22_11395 [Pseudomonadota bacterium]|nr:hypothetical protein [Pseudomonadota bacterium]
MEKVDQLIGGVSAPPESGDYGDSFNPTSGQLKKSVALGSALDFDAVVPAANTAIPEWPT